MSVDQSARAQTIPVVDSCQEADYLDRTAVDADRAFDWDFPFAGSDERCIKIRQGQAVTWVGSFGTHPLQSDQGDAPNPIGGVDQGGATATVTFTRPGVFGYRCQFHFEMRGAIWVVAPPAAPVPAGGVGLIALLAVGLIGAGVRVIAGTRTRTGV